MSKIGYTNSRDLSKDEVRATRRADYESSRADFDESNIMSFLEADAFADEFLDTHEITYDTKGHEFHNMIRDLDYIHYKLSSAYSRHRIKNIIDPSGSLNIFNEKKGNDNVVELSDLDRTLCNTCGTLYRSATMTENGEFSFSEVVYGDPTPGARFRVRSKIAMETCEYKDGFPAYSVEIDIPSGKMAIANHFPQFDMWEGDEYNKHSDDYNICYLYGRKKCTELAASKGFIEMNIGNCGCDMFQIDELKEKFMVGYEYENEDDHDSGFFDKYYTKVGSVCTDYWGYFIVDADELKRRGGELEHRDGNRYVKADCTSQDVYLVDCVPGRYRFTHRYHLLEDSDTSCVYTEIERVGDVQ